MLKQLQAVQKILARLSKREKIILYAVVFFILLLFLDRLIIYPIYSRIKSLNDDIRARETAVIKNLRILAQKEQIAGEAKSYASFLGKSASSSEDGDMTVILKAVEGLANKSSIYIVDMKPAGSKEEKDGTKRYLVNLNCEGQMEQIMDFMYNLENANELLTIEKYQISPKTKDSSVAQCSMSIAKVIIP